MGGPGANDDDRTARGGADEDEAMATSSRTDQERDATPTTFESGSDHDVAEPSHEPAQPPKRKGGRKPIYATSEERKQRNRQAQAAFRERRTEYIKKLEAENEQLEQRVKELQTTQRTSADECLLLRYHTSLLERVLSEKGIDIKMEIQMKSGDHLGLHPPAANMPQVPQTQPPLQRTAVQRQQARRSGNNFTPRIAAGQSSSDGNFQASAPGHPTPSSHASSPTNPSMQSPTAMYQAANTPPTSATLTPAQGQQAQVSRGMQQPPTNFFQPAQQTASQSQRTPSFTGAGRFQDVSGVASTHSSSGRGSAVQPSNAGNLSSAGSASTYYPSPFQKHVDQLEHDYDAQEARSMLGPTESDGTVPNAGSASMPGAYQSSFDQQQRQRPDNIYNQNTMGSSMQVPQPQSSPNQFDSNKHDHPSSTPSQTNYSATTPMLPAGNSFAAMGIDPNDPLLNADPFGLSASMHYPTAYSFEPPPR